MGISICGGRMWSVDDFTFCFQETKCCFKKDYQPLSQEANGDYPGNDDFYDGENDPDLMLHKAITNASTIDEYVVDRPKGQIAVNVFEVALVLVQVGVSIFALADRQPHETSREWSVEASVASLVSWIYILLLVVSRLVFGSPSVNDQSLSFWNHVAFLYASKWVIDVFLFRSALMQSEYPARVPTIVHFAISFVLLLLTLTTRKGDKTVMVQQENGLTPPKDQFASLFALATYSWLDALIWKGYKAPLEISDVWNLRPGYHASAVLRDWRAAKRVHSLALSLLMYFDTPLLLQGAWTVLSSCLVFAPTWLLKLVLEYVQDPEGHSKHAAWLYVGLMFCSTSLEAVANGQGLWIGRKLSVKLRAIIVGELYAKALRRKAGASAVSKADKRGDGEAASDASQYKQSSDDDGDKGEQKIEEDDEATIGKILNLMAIDSFKVSEICAYLHYLWASVPVQLIVSIALLYKILGFSSFAGVALMALILPINMLVARQFIKVQRKILAATDARIHSTNEVLTNIRIIKYFAWEARFEDIVDDKRRTELKELWKRYILWSCAATLWYGTPILITFTCFFLYTVVEGNRLVPSVAFPALSMFQLLRVPLDRLADMVAHVQESKVSIDRVERFLAEEETEKYQQLDPGDIGREPRIALDNATLAWHSPGTKTTVDSEEQAAAEAASSKTFRLIDISLDFHIGALNVIAGPTGSGKSSLLMALLGEMKLLSGEVHLPGSGIDRPSLRPDPYTGMTESVAYCAQEAWLVNATIRDNITFASEWDEARYTAVLKACALERDMQILDMGDQTLVGEKGISLSGGQKQRISLARAIYSHARHLLLDDCLSAVDSHTAQHIVQEAFMGPLMYDRTCILVTHNVALVAQKAEFVVLMKNGKVVVHGTPAEVASCPEAAKHMLVEELESAIHSEQTSVTVTRNPSEIDLSRSDQTPQDSPGVMAPRPVMKKKGHLKYKSAAPPPALVEEKSEGSVKWSTIRFYLSCMGHWYYWVFTIIGLGMEHGFSVATNVWIRQWANAYTKAPAVVNTADVNSTMNAMVGPERYEAMNVVLAPGMTTSAVQRLSFRHVPGIRLLADHMNSQEDVSSLYYLGVYALIGTIYCCVGFTMEFILFWGSLHASRIIHTRLIRAVTHAKFRFFDSTPLGRLMNRFSKDIEAVDQEVAPVARGVIQCAASILIIVVLITVITPAFLFAAIFIALVYIAIGTLYMRPSRDLKRLESVQRSPLYQQFGETLTGIVTIRAYGDAPRFIADNHALVDTYNRPYLYLWAANRWLAFRVDVAGALVSFFSATFIILSTGRIDAGAAGLALTYAVTFTENVLWFVRMYAELQQSMNSMERVEEYIEVEQEAPPVIPDSRPPGNWPDKGEVKFEGYSTRYRADLNLVLKGVTFRAAPGERIGVVGRTGAGKSSLALALFRGLEAEEGRIVIDGVDISKIGLHDLRENITIVPQDPTLFTGTIRSNLDMFGLFTDEEIFTALRKVHLIRPDDMPQTSGSSSAPLHETSRTLTTMSPSPALLPESTPRRGKSDNKNPFLNLESPISESGSNLSQGQRQLLCLARALLKNPKVLMMDEATASIDYATDARIQETLRELKGNTIITIAHRLQTIVDYDKVMVLDHGELKEFDAPWNLINLEGGIFRGMCENSGNLETLVEMAKKAWQQKRLIDD
ncbi:hypothetical protein KEM54_000408 [Ascosphaera aggregata]|nr:hypothetical protein KEM54_000408 [Ascosphaera aggregata]